MDALPSKPTGARRAARRGGSERERGELGQPQTRREQDAHQSEPPEQRPQLRPPRIGRRVATMGLVVVLAAALLAGVPGLRGVARELGQISPAWLILAVALEIASEIRFVGVFRLFFDRLPAREARRLAWTELGSGALLPAGGAGGLAIGAWLMHLAGLSTPWIARRSAGLFWLGAGVSAAALIAAGFALMAGAPGPHDFLRAGLPVVFAAPAMLLIATLPWTLGRYSRCPRWLRAVSSGVEEAWSITFSRDAGWRPLGALGYLLFDVAVLGVALKAVGHPPPSLAALVMAYSIGYIANSLPVPGGLGALDAGLAGTLVLYGVSATHAAAAVIVYHFIALSVPGIGGFYAYLRLRPRILESPAEPRPPIATHPRTPQPEGGTP